MTKRAFTLVEVLVSGAVMVLLLLIAGGALFTGARSSSKGIEKLDEISRLSRLGEYFKKSLRFASQVQHDQPSLDREEYHIRFIDEISPADGSRSEKMATFSLLGGPGGPKKVAIDIAGRQQMMEFEHLDLRMGVAGNLMTVVLDGGKGRAVEISVASPYMVALSGAGLNALDALSGGAANEGAGPPLTATPPTAKPSAATALAVGATGPVVAAAGAKPQPAGDRVASADAPPLEPGPGSSLDPAQASPGGEASTRPADGTVTANAQTADLGPGMPAGRTTPRAARNVPAGAPPPDGKLTIAGPGGKVGGTPPQAGPEDNEPEVETVDDTGATIAGPPGRTRPGAPRPVMRPTMHTPGTIDPPPAKVNTEATEPAAAPPPGTRPRRQPLPMSPKDAELLQRMPRGTDAPARDRPPRPSQTMDLAPRPDGAMNQPF